jgi:hypothetical protein
VLYIMIAALTAGSAVCCFGVAYASHMILPVKPVTPAEILKNQSTLNTLNFLTKDELKIRSIQDRITAYTSGRANLIDVLLVTTDKPTLNQAYVVVAKKIETFPPGSEERGQYEFLRKAADDHLSGFVPKQPEPNQLAQAQNLVASIPFPAVPTPSQPPSSATLTPTGGRRRRSSISD